MTDEAIQAELAEIRHQLGRLVPRVQESVRSEVTEARVAIMARIDHLSDAITAIREDIKVNFGASETVRRANEHTREELRDTQNMIADMRRQLLSMGERLAHLEQKPPAP